jgi:hypothetical protein
LKGLPETNCQAYYKHFYISWSVRLWQAFLAYIRLGWKGLSRTNALAYCEHL